MDIRAIIKSQYNASLDMMQRAIEQCPDDLWDNDQFKNRFWHVTYHALFYTHLYLAASDNQYIPWEKRRPDYHLMGPTPWPPHETPQIDEPYSRPDLLDFLAVCRQQVEQQVSAVDLHGPSGFDWLPMSKLELQFYNIRHIHLHLGELCERLGETAGVEVGWVGMSPA